MNTTHIHPINAARSLALLASLCGSLLLADAAQATVILTLTDNTGSPTSVDVNPGVAASRFFSFNINLTTTEPITGLTYLLETPNAGGSGKFQITARDTTGALFTGSNLTTTNGSVLLAVNALLDPRNNNDLGGTVSDPFVDCILPGTYFVATLTMEALSTISTGTYTIQTALQSATGCQPNFDELPIARATYSVNVVPEPASAWLLCLGGALLGGTRRRRMDTSSEGTRRE